MATLHSPRQVAAVYLGTVALAFLPILGNVPETEAEKLWENSGTDRLALVESAALPIASHFTPPEVIGTIRVVITGYSSTPEQTDDTPFITASGKTVRDGIVATNILPLGTKIRIPDLYGERIFVVEDRMNVRKTYNVDIWFASYWDAKKFGVRQAYIEILEG